MQAASAIGDLREQLHDAGGRRAPSESTIGSTRAAEDDAISTA